MLELNQPPTSAASGGMLSFLSNMEHGRAGLVLNPPLAALSTMTDMKSLYSSPPAKSLSPQSPPQLSPQGLSPQELSPYSVGTATSSSASITTVATPHGIENILNRPTHLITTSAGFAMGGMGGLGRLSGGMGLYGGLAGKMAELARPASVYWPGVQGMLQNPLFWRDRIQAGHGKSLYLTL
ncbi:UNVERIFIED_CONTAM: hypothetical protein RMT77_007125 [Armadillidium vulgare]